MHSSDLSSRPFVILGSRSVLSSKGELASTNGIVSFHNLTAIEVDPSQNGSLTWVEHAYTQASRKISNLAEYLPGANSIDKFAQTYYLQRRAS